MTIAHLPRVPWGAVQLVMENATFAAGYEQGRFIYFNDSPEIEMDGTGGALLSSTEALGMIVLRNDTGHFVPDADICVEEDGLERQLGILVGFLSGPLYAQTPEEEANWEKGLAYYGEVEREALCLVETGEREL